MTTQIVSLANILFKIHSIYKKKKKKEGNITDMFENVLLINFFYHFFHHY